MDNETKEIRCEQNLIKAAAWITGHLVTQTVDISLNRLWCIHTHSTEVNCYSEDDNCSVAQEALRLSCNWTAHCGVAVPNVVNTPLEPVLSLINPVHTSRKDDCLLMIEAVGTAATSVSFHENTRHSIPEDRYLRTRQRQNLISQTHMFSLFHINLDILPHACISKVLSPL